jgi:cysteinyl-tRNA synthetase
MADKWLWSEAVGKLTESGRAHPHQFDIHGGGIDLLFPHHEDEIAQSRCAFHTPTLASYWMHNGFLQVEGEKMSKSLGNFMTIRDLLRNWPGDVLRLNMLHTHYRHPIDWTRDGLITSLKELQAWTDLIAFHLGEGAEAIREGGAVDEGVIGALLDDLNTPLALSRVHKVFDLAQSNPSKVVDLAATLAALGFKNLSKPGLFHQGFAASLFESGPQIGPEEMRQIQLYRTGVANNFPDVVSASTRYLETAGFVIKMNDAGILFIGNKTSAEMRDNRDPEAQLRAEVQNLIDKRSTARRAKDFIESDRIRDELGRMGVELEDHKDKPTTWKFRKAER